MPNLLSSVPFFSFFWVELSTILDKLVELVQVSKNLGLWLRAQHVEGEEIRQHANQIPNFRNAREWFVPQFPKSNWWIKANRILTAVSKYRVQGPVASSTPVPRLPAHEICTAATRKALPRSRSMAPRAATAACAHQRTDPRQRRRVAASPLCRIPISSRRRPHLMPPLSHQWNVEGKGQNALGFLAGMVLF